MVLSPAVCSLGGAGCRDQRAGPVFQRVSPYSGTDVPISGMIA